MLRYIHILYAHKHTYVYLQTYIQTYIQRLMVYYWCFGSVDKFTPLPCLIIEYMLSWKCFRTALRNSHGIERPRSHGEGFGFSDSSYLKTKTRSVDETRLPHSSRWSEISSIGIQLRTGAHPDDIRRHVGGELHLQGWRHWQWLWSHIFIVCNHCQRYLTLSSK